MKFHNLATLAFTIHTDNIRAGWWKQDEETGRTLARNTGELLALVHSEISEADEGLQGNLMDDKLPHRLMVEVELADTAIRALDMLGYYKWDGTVDVSVLAHETLKGAHKQACQAWLAAMHRLTSAALEGFRKGNAAVGVACLADLVATIYNCGASLGYDIDGAIEEKRAFNAQRLDHKPEHRAAVGGKQF